MKSYRFYLEYGDAKSKRKGEHRGNVIAIIDTMGDGFRPQWVGDRYGLECIAAVYDYPNSPVCGTGTTREYLGETCKRIPEATARQIHPNLFIVLDEHERQEKEQTA